MEREREREREIVNQMNVDNNVKSYRTISIFQMNQTCDFLQFLDVPICLDICNDAQISISYTFRN